MIQIIRKLAIVSTPEARPWLIAYLASVVLASLLEIVGVGVIFAFFQVMLDPSKLARLPVLGVFQPTGNPTLFLVSMCAIAFAAYALRTFVLLLSTWLGLAIRQRLQWQLSDILFRSYLEQPYVWHLNASQIRLFQNVTNNSGAVVQNALLAAVDIVSCAVLLLIFGAALAWLRPAET